MLIQFSFDTTAFLYPIIDIMVLIILMVIMVYLYSKHRIFLPILTVYLFSLVIGLMALEINGFPFTPVLQTFFILFQTVFFVLTIIKMIKG